MSNPPTKISESPYPAENPGAPGYAIATTAKPLKKNERTPLYVAIFALVVLLVVGLGAVAWTILSERTDRDTQAALQEEQQSASSLQSDSDTDGTAGNAETTGDGEGDAASRGNALPEDTSSISPRPQPTEPQPDETQMTPPSYRANLIDNPEAQRQVNRQISQRIERCLRDTHFVPAGCENTLYMEDPGWAITKINRQVTAPGTEFFSSNGQNYVRLSGGNLTISYLQRWAESDQWEPGQIIRRYGIFDRIVLPVYMQNGDAEVDFSKF